MERSVYLGIEEIIGSVLIVVVFNWGMRSDPKVGKYGLRYFIFVHVHDHDTY